MCPWLTTTEYSYNTYVDQQGHQHKVLTSTSDKFKPCLGSKCMSFLHASESIRDINIPNGNNDRCGRTH